MNKTIFVLEDMEIRMPVFEKIADQTGMKLVHSYSEVVAKKIFLDADPEVVFLDHDLGGQQFVSSDNDETGASFARWIKKNDPNYEKRTIIVHSANPGGSDNIRAILGTKTVIMPIMRFAQDQSILYRTGLLSEKE